MNFKALIMSLLSSFNMLFIGLVWNNPDSSPLVGFSVIAFCMWLIYIGCVDE